MGSNSAFNNAIQSGIFAEPVGVLVEKFVTFAQNELALILDSDDEYKKLKRTDVKVKALVDCVTTRQQRWCYSSQRAVQLWLRDVQSVLHDADDLLYGIDLEFMKLNSNTDMVGLHTEDEVGKLVFSRLKLTIPHEMAKIRGKLESMAKEMDGLFMTELLNNPQPNFLGNLQTSSVVNNSFMIEREDAKVRIMSMLFEEGTTDNISVVSIVGMAGIGKTTLAQFVYNDEYVVHHFDLRIWVSISTEDSVEKITNSIFVSITDTTMLHVLDLNIVQTRLQNMLSGKRFLIVLDGMWNENGRDLDVLLLPFKNAARRGSKILVTTRSMIVSRFVSKLPAYHMLTLSDEKCWNLIKERALPSINEDDRQEFEEMGFKIAQKCRGLPLAAKVMGNILQIKSDKEEWEDVLKSKLWDLKCGANELLPTLKMSYDHLPYFLKRCFYYCSIFPHSYEFKRDELVRLWIAEGFIQQSSVRRCEDIGKEYFDLLLLRSFFQVSHRYRSNHPIYKMHDLIHDLAQLVSDGICFRMEDNISHPLSNLEDSRHASLLCEDIQPKTWRVFHRCGNLRTFILLSQGAHELNKIPHDIFSKMPYIRVLNLSYTSIRELPDTIKTLKHLRHLDVSNTKIESLPESITDLRGLETIKLKNCMRFARLPKEMRNLTKLRHLELDIKGQLDSLPTEFGKLTSLETLSAFLVAREKGQQIKELKDMNCLRGDICITNLENVTNNREAIAARLDQKPNLDKLELEWKVTSHLTAPEVLGGLQPHSFIKVLVIRGYSGALFPAWLTSPSFCKLQSIYLHKCYQCTVLPSLGELPMLKSLYIHRMPDLSIVDRNFIGGSFPSLSELKFNDMPHLTEWRDLTNGNMPKLCYLRIEKCPTFKFLPSLQYLSCLKTLEISNCPQVQFLPNGEVPESLSSLIVEDCGMLLNTRDILLDQYDPSIIRSISYVEVDGHILQR